MKIHYILVTLYAPIVIILRKNAESNKQIHICTKHTFSAFDEDLMEKITTVTMAFLFLLLMTPLIYAQAGHPVAHPLKALVTLDGKHTTPSEWADTSEFEIEVGVRGPVAYFSVKYDSSYLYTMWDFIECRKAFNGNSTEKYPSQVLMYFDPLYKRTVGKVDTSMYRFAVLTGYLPAGRVAASRGTGSGSWADWDSSNTQGITSRIQYTSSPHSQQSHMIAEIRVPLKFAELQSHVQGTIGVVLRFSDRWTHVYAEYPATWDEKDPSSWGNLEFSQTPMPELAAAFAPLLMSLLSITALGTTCRLQQSPSYANYSRTRL